jgi:hypothetical protein
MHIAEHHLNILETQSKMEQQMKKKKKNYMYLLTPNLILIPIRTFY